MSTIVINLNKSFALKPNHLPLDLDAIPEPPSTPKLTATDRLYKPYVAWTGYGAASNITLNGIFDETHPIPLKACELFDFQLWHAAPVLSNKWAYLGEPGKFVPVSKQRTLSVSVSSSGVVVVIAGDEGEKVELAFAKPLQTGGIVSVVCTVGASGKATATVGATATCK
jgi:hypothetical protein